MPTFNAVIQYNFEKCRFLSMRELINQNDAMKEESELKHQPLAPAEIMPLTYQVLSNKFIFLTYFR